MHELGHALPRHEMHETFWYAAFPMLRILKVAPLNLSFMSLIQWRPAYDQSNYFVHNMYEVEMVADSIIISC